MKVPSEAPSEVPPAVPFEPAKRVAPASGEIDRLTITSRVEARNIVVYLARSMSQVSWNLMVALQPVVLQQENGKSETERKTANVRISR